MAPSGSTSVRTNSCSITDNNAAVLPLIQMYPPRGTPLTLTRRTLLHSWSLAAGASTVATSTLAPASTVSRADVRTLRRSKAFRCVPATGYGDHAGIGATRSGGRCCAAGAVYADVRVTYNSDGTVFVWLSLPECV